MTGSAFTIDLPGPVCAERLAELETALRALATDFEEPRTGSYDLTITTGDATHSFTVNIAGPGFGDEGVFRAAHAGDADLEPLIGFTPTHDVVVALNGARDPAEGALLAELAAVVQGVVGGVVDIKVPPRLLNVVRDLPGISAVAERTDEWFARLFCTGEFLRAWVAAQEFPNYSLGLTPPGSTW